MNDEEDERAWQEITKAMRAFQDSGSSPKMILLPEVSLPRTRLPDFEKLVVALNLIAVTGVDYRLDHHKHLAKNEGIVFVPRGFFRSRPSRLCTRIVFGKTYPAPEESAKLKRLAPPWSFQGEFRVHVFDCEQYGRVGVSICYDFMDIERALMYRGKIQHLFVLAYNRDLKMFRSLAESLSRTVFCNVVVCNTGFYGGSIAMSPYYDANERILYSHDGASLFTTQVVRLPVAALMRAQERIRDKQIISKALGEGKRRTDRLFKDPPPGYPEDPAQLFQN
jgi:predicted amidohydrolase